MQKSIKQFICSYRGHTDLLLVSKKSVLLQDWEPVLLLLLLFLFKRLIVKLFIINLEGINCTMCEC